MTINIKPMLPGARKLLNDCLDIKQNESLLIVADIPNENVAKAILEAGKAKDIKVDIVLIEPLTRHGEDPPQTVAQEMKSVDTAILATEFSMSHSKARKDANIVGTRIISLPGCKEELLISGGIEADFIHLKPKVEELGHLLSLTNLVTLTSPQGTNLTIELCGRKSVDQTCIVRNYGEWAPCPIVETAVGPREDGLEGIIIVDGVIIPGGLVKDPVTITFKKGKIVDIKGKDEAKLLKKTLADFKHPNVYQAVELGIGLNPKSRMGRGLMSEDESQFGTVHIGLGQGHTFGVPVSAPSHMDMVIRNPVIKLDGQELLANNKFSFGPFANFNQLKT